MYRCIVAVNETYLCTFPSQTRLTFYIHENKLLLILAPNLGTITTGKDCRKLVQQLQKGARQKD